jgi:hypothetical protein
MGCQTQEGEDEFKKRLVLLFIPPWLSTAFHLFCHFWFSIQIWDLGWSRGSKISLWFSLF